MGENNQRPIEATKSDTMRVRVKSRFLTGRMWPDGKKDGPSVDVYANPGDVIELPTKEAEALLGRSFEGYPGAPNSVGKLPGLIRDSPIERV